MKKTNNSKLVAVLIALAAFAVGRYSVPKKVEIVKEQVLIKNTEKQTDETTDLQKNRTKKTIVITKKDGTKVEITKETNKDSKKTDKATKTTEYTKTETKESKTVVARGSKVSFGLLGGAKFSTPKILDNDIVYGLYLNKEIIGPFTVGAWCLSNTTAGLSLGVNL